MGALEVAAGCTARQDIVLRADREEVPFATRPVVPSHATTAYRSQIILSYYSLIIPWIVRFAYCT